MKLRLNIDKIRKHVAALGVSGHSFAYDCGVNRHSWDDVMASRHNPNLETAYKIARRMKLKVDDLLIIEE